MDQSPAPQYKIGTSQYREFKLFVQSFLSGVFTFFNLKKTKRFWGIVYDSVTKQPLDPVIVKLLYVDGREVETGITDLGGRYGFLAQPGKFKIFVRKSNYIFPSKLVTGEVDGIYENIYHGEFFTLFENSEVVAPNIPMDPEKFDWNQQAKKDMGKSYHPYVRLLLKQLVAIAFWLGFLFVLLQIWRTFPDIPLYLIVIVAAYIGLLFLASITPEPRLWGRLKFSINLGEYEEIVLELHNPKFPEISFGKSKVRGDERFLLRGGKGQYLLTVNKVNNQNKEKTVLASKMIRIDRRGLVNSTFYVKLN